MSKHYFFLLLCCFASPIFTMQLHRVRPTVHHKKTTSLKKVSTRTACTCIATLRDAHVEPCCTDKNVIKERIDLYDTARSTILDDKMPKYTTEPMREAYLSACPHFATCVTKNKIVHIGCYAGAAALATACMIMPTAACENFIATGIVGALLGVALSTANEGRNYLAMIATTDTEKLQDAYARFELLLKEHQKMGHEEKKEQL